MSDTTTDGTRTPHADPVTEPPTALTGAPAAIYTQLTVLTDPEGATAAELALAAGVGRSTAGKALTTLEQHGLAVRTPGGFDGPRRTPDRWHPASTPTKSTPTKSTPANSSDDGPSDQKPVSTQPEPSAANPPESAASSAGDADSAADETAPDTPAASDTSHDEGDGEDDHDSTEEDPHNDDSDHSPQDERTPAPPTGTSQQPAPVVAITSPGGKKRLAPGALRQMVIDHLQAHPGEAFTATKISRKIEKSSGAIANSLVVLARQGIAEQVSDRPRTYRLATPEDNG